MYPILTPLPPLPEQQRIVERIGQMMALCDTLNQQVDAATGKHAQHRDGSGAGEYHDV